MSGFATEFPIRMVHGLRVAVSDSREWFVLVGNRLVVAAAITLAFGLGVLALTMTSVTDVTSTPRLIYLLQTIVGGNITLLTIVLSINQLVLSRELKTPGELHEQIENVVRYRTRVEGTTRTDALPATPDDFLQLLLDGTRENAQRLGGVVREAERDRLVREVNALVTRLTSHADDVRSVQEYSQGGIFSALAVLLETNYSDELNEAQRIRTTYDEELEPATRRMLEELIANLKQVDVARQYFKSLYTQSELARLSRILLYIGVPAVGSALLLFLVSVDGPSETIAVRSYLSASVIVVVTLGFAPLAVLFSFVLRVATVAQRTVAITPFATPTQESDIGD